MRKTIKGAAALSAALLLTATAGWAKEPPSKRFITEAIQGNYAEIAMGQLAEQNGSSEAVKSFGQTLVTDHTDANQKAMAAAQAAGVTPPTGPSKKQQAMHDRMAKMQGAAFDRAFAREMVADHSKDAAQYRKESKRSDAQVSEYASTTLPTIEQHLQTAKGLPKR